MMSPKAITAGTSWLSEYIIHQVSENANPDFTQSAVQTLISMVFHKFMIPFERVLLAFILHPSNDTKAKIGLSIIFVSPDSNWREISFRLCYNATNARKDSHFTR